MAAQADAPIATSEAPVHDLTLTRSLIATGVSISELKRLQFSASILKEAGCSAKDLQHAYSCQDIKAAGFEPLNLLLDHLLGGCGWRGDQFSGFTVHELKNAGFSAEQLQKLGSSHLKDMGISQLDVKWLVDGGFSARELRLLNFDALRLKDAGCSLRAAHFSACELKNAGFGVTWLLANGWNAAQLASRVNDSAIFSAVEMHEAGADAKSLSRVGYTLQDLRACGFDTQQLSDAGAFTYTDGCIRDCCINVFERAGCDHIPHEKPLEYKLHPPCSPSYYFCELPCEIFWILLSGRCFDGEIGERWRLFNWFFQPFEAFLGKCSVCNLRNTHALKSQGCLLEQLGSFFLYIAGFAYSLVCSTVSLFACLPCFLCFSLARCVRKLNRSKPNDRNEDKGYNPIFWIIYTPLLFMAMSGRWMWKIICCRRSCFGFSRGACGPSCTSKHQNSVVFAESVCMLCGRRPQEHTQDFHTCEDGRRGAFLWTGPENDIDVDQSASQV